MIASLVNPRRVKQFIAPLLPETLKAPLRGRMFGFRDAGVRFPVTFSQDDRSHVVSLGNGLRFRYQEEDRFDVRFHFVENGESIEEMSGFIELARSASVLFDVGSAKSIFSQIFCLLRPGKRAFAYEPSPTMMGAAARWLALNGCASNVCLRQSAVGSQTGVTAGRVHADGFVSMTSDRSGGDAVDIEITSIDHEVELQGVEPDLLKIDVEGDEYNVLLGARDLLRRRKPPIAFELHLDEVERRGIGPELIVSELQSHGYTFTTCLGAELRASDVYNSPKAILRFIAR